jgi:hypothetical protein
MVIRGVREVGVVALSRYITKMKNEKLCFSVDLTAGLDTCGLCALLGW